MTQPSIDPVVFGVLNVTPDSFSDAGRFLDPHSAIAHGLALTALGADVVDIGGESTRPGAAPVDPEEEARRVLPVIRELVAAGVRVSIDTRRGSVAAAAVDAGAVFVNDVDGGKDPDLLRVAAEADVDLVLMHSRGPSGVKGRYRDVVHEVAEDLLERTDAALAAGVRPERLIVDPGIGFSKTGAENWQLLAHLDELRIGDLRMLVGVSRKRFLGDLVPGAAEERDGVTAVLSALLAERDIWGLRVHDPGTTRAALTVVRRMREAE